jgi:protein-disulfide isomerase
MDTPKGTLFDRYGMPVALLVGLVVIAAAIYFGHGLQPATTAATATGPNGAAAPAVNIANLKTAGEPYIGNANAPVTMALFFDYQCPFCKQFDQTVLNQIYTNYVQTGKVKVVFKDFQFLGPDSTVDAEFARAVWAAYPNQFYAWFTAMFAAQDEENTGFGDLASVEKLTATVPGIDVTKVEALMTQNKAAYDTAIDADRAEGAADGIQGTPSVMIGTTLLQGAQTYATVSGLLDAQINK